MKNEQTDKTKCYVSCSRCGQRVSNEVLSSLPEGLVVRAFVECVDCVVNTPEMKVLSDEEQQLDIVPEDLEKARAYLSSIGYELDYERVKKVIKAYLQAEDRKPYLKPQ